MSSMRPTPSPVSTEGALTGGAEAALDAEAEADRAFCPDAADASCAQTERAASASVNNPISHSSVSAAGADRGTLVGRSAIALLVAVAN
jgi:hypothetical protein